jgi:hypothetical protein
MSGADPGLPDQDQREAERHCEKDLDSTSQRTDAGNPRARNGAIWAAVAARLPEPRWVRTG